MILINKGYVINHQHLNREYKIHRSAELRNISFNSDEKKYIYNCSKEH